MKVEITGIVKILESTKDVLSKINECPLQTHFQSFITLHASLRCMTLS